MQARNDDMLIFVDYVPDRHYNRYMRKGSIPKIIVLNAIIAIVNILLFSNPFLHFSLTGANILVTAFGITAIVMSVIVFFYGNYKLLTHREEVLQIQDLKSLGDCVAAIDQNKNKKTFSADMEIVLDQVKRFRAKKESIRDVLLQKFTVTEMSYAKFQNATEELEQVMYLNIKSMLNKVIAFDDEEYRQIKDQNMHKSLALRSRLELYDQYVGFVERAVTDNEQILFKLDQLLMAVLKLNTIESGEIENMPAMKGIDQLIHDAKWYR